MMKLIVSISLGVLLISGCQPNTQSDSSQFSLQVTQAIQDFQGNPGARYENDYTVPRTLLPLLKPGLSQNEVKAILGSPDTFSTNEQTISWSYTLFYSMFINILFDENGKLAEVHSPLLEE